MLKEKKSTNHLIELKLDIFLPFLNFHSRSKLFLFKSCSYCASPPFHMLIFKTPSPLWGPHLKRGFPYKIGANTVFFLYMSFFLVAYFMMSQRFPWPKWEWKVCLGCSSPPLLSPRRASFSVCVSRAQRREPQSAGLPTVEKPCAMKKVRSECSRRGQKAVNGMEVSVHEVMQRAEKAFQAARAF